MLSPQTGKSFQCALWRKSRLPQVSGILEKGENSENGCLFTLQNMQVTTLTVEGTLLLRNPGPDPSLLVPCSSHTSTLNKTQAASIESHCDRNKGKENELFPVEG